jgi:trypsin
MISVDTGTGAGPCDGDRGGPLIMNDSGKVVGLISWGFGCAIKGYPGVYTKLSFYLDWMASVGST